MSKRLELGRLAGRCGDGHGVVRLRTTSPTQGVKSHAEDLSGKNPEPDAGNRFIFCPCLFVSRLEIRIVRGRQGRLPG
jgi:hypothetical protein